MSVFSQSLKPQYKILIQHLCLFILCFIKLPDVSAQASLSYYMDNRDFNTFAVTIASSQMPYGFSIWGFTDFHSDQNSETEREDFTRSFSEYRLSNNQLSNWTGIEGLGLQAEYNDVVPGNNNATIRGGITYKYKFLQTRWVQFRWFPLQSNKDLQASLTYGIPFTPQLSLSGFADYNIREGKENQWVIEPELNYKLSDRTWLLLEYRYNGFEEGNVNLDGKGWALGLRYKL